ncbi:MAG: endonuclease/exonuclease/phosphatase family protein [Pirellulaceae bacterium]
MMERRASPKTPDPLQRHPSGWQSLARMLASVFASCALVLIILTICGFFGRHWWRLEQAAHFRVQYFWLLFAAAVALWLVRRPRIALASAAGALVNLALVAPIYLPAPETKLEGPQVRLVSYNVLGRNERFDEVLQFLRKENADLVLLMEVRPAWAERIAELADIYPHQHIVPRDDNFGIALVSKLPWKEVHTHDFGVQVPTIVATYDLSGTPLVVIGAHPVPPSNVPAAAQRNEHLAAIGRFASLQSAPVVVAGDLNLTRFSPYFHDLLEQGDLADSRQGFGIQASWTPRLPVLTIAIDHCLISPRIAVLDRRVGSYFGSDHRPVIVHLQLSSAEVAPRFEHRGGGEK